MTGCPCHDVITFGHTDLRCPHRYRPAPYAIRACPPGCRAQHEHPPGRSAADPAEHQRVLQAAADVDRAWDALAGLRRRLLERSQP